MIAPTDINAISPYRVNVTVDGCTSPLAIPVEVIVNELPQAIATNGGAICPGETAQLLANPIAGATYEWREILSGDIVSTIQNPNLILNTTTTFELIVTTADGCISNPTDQTTITVNPEPVIAPSFVYNVNTCLLYTSPSPRDQRGSRMPSSA